MEIKITQKKWNLIFNRYDIFLNSELVYKSESILFSIKDSVAIYSLGERKLLTVKKDHDFNNLMNYSLEFDNGTAKLRSQSFIESNIKNPKGYLNFYEQRGNLIGVFQNDEQVGYISRNLKKVLGQDKYTIVYENGAVDPLILIGFSIAYDIENHNDYSLGVTWDFGIDALKPVKEIDPNWTPKK